MTLTATAEPETAAPPPIAERPVFAATTPTRPRALRLAGRVTAGLVALWLVALVLGTFGFGPVAGIGLPRIGGGSDGAKPQRSAAARRTPRAQQPNERVTASGVTLMTRYGAPAAAATSRRTTGPTGSTRRSAVRQTPGSRSGSGGTPRGSTPSGTSGGSSATAQAPASSSTPATSATPTTSSTTTTTTNPHANTTHSQTTPPGSSSTAPGSRSNAGTAPGRDQSTASPSPGSGRSEHAPPKG